MVIKFPFLIGCLHILLCKKREEELCLFGKMQGLIPYIMMEKQMKEIFVM